MTHNKPDEWNPRCHSVHCSLSDYPLGEENRVQQRSTPRTGRLLVSGTAVAIALSISSPVVAQVSSPEPAAPGATPVLERSLYKTLVFEGATNTIDLLLFGSVLGGHLYAGPAFVAINATAAVAIYYGHEVAWGYLGPPEADYDIEDNLLKGITFRLASSTRAFAVGYGFTGDPVTAGGFMVGSAIGETIVYVANEYGWAFYDELRKTELTTPVRAVSANWQGTSPTR